MSTWKGIDIFALVLCTPCFELWGSLKNSCYSHRSLKYLWLYNITIIYRLAQSSKHFG